MWTGGVRVIILDDENRMLMVKQHHEDHDIWTVSYTHLDVYKRQQSGCCISGRWHDDSCRGRQTLHRTDDKSHCDERAADFGRPYDIRKACRQRQRSSSWIVKRKFQ